MDKFATTTKHIKKSPQVHKVNMCAMCAGHDDNPLMRRIQMSLCLEELSPVGGGLGNITTLLDQPIKPP